MSPGRGALQRYTAGADQGASPGLGLVLASEHMAFAPGTAMRPTADIEFKRHVDLFSSQGVSILRRWMFVKACGVTTGGLSVTVPRVIPKAVPRAPQEPKYASVPKKTPFQSPQIANRGQYVPSLRHSNCERRSSGQRLRLLFVRRIEREHRHGADCEPRCRPVGSRHFPE